MNDVVNAGPGAGPDVTVVVVTHAGRHLVQPCLDSLAAQSAPHRLLVVDNHSTDGTAELLAARLQADEILRTPANLGFAGAVAAALQVVGTRFVALLNDDAVADPDWLAQLLAVARDDPDAAAWTSLMLQFDHPELVNNAGAGLTPFGYGVDLAPDTPADAVPVGPVEVFGFCGGAALLRTDAVRAVGGFPAEYFLYYEDLDTGWRLRLAGWTIRRVPGSRVLHHHAATTDRRSELFHRHNERNRLWTLLRCAPLTFALTGLVRFVLTTASLALRQRLRADARQAAADHPNFRVGLRVGVLLETLRALPRLLRGRGRISAIAVRGRGAVLGEGIRGTLREQGHHPGR
ncbi:glycosyltransferase [Nakamurella sp. YIM 132087]|uniref:Glycosyltransferase n=1 Tax=Nakamurella alba TaxID=2665158 RepID=A0A7K1FJ12_9ACTN|nr:glycosyltransferase family 2 protein [Nakamurella alba]MTD14125.1 glycosyltransferase [Nakamurella alba]